jgi:hypothetical protein
MSPLNWAARRSRATVVVVPKPARDTSEAWPQMGAPKYDVVIAGIWFEFMSTPPSVRLGAGFVRPDVRTSSIGTVKVPLRRGKEQLI